MVIVGGTYSETCVTPARIALFGSGGRAAMALVGLHHDIHLHTFHPEGLKDDVLVNFEPFGIEVTVHPSRNRFLFDYLHPLAAPRIVPLPRPKGPPVEIAGDKVLRFGCLEGDFRVTAKLAVYDPQSGNTPSAFGENGSTAERLAVVLNADEIRRLAQTDDIGIAAGMLMSRDNTEAIVVKDGASGAYVFDGSDMPRHVPAYPTRTVYKIGSGDVFSATFAHAWLSERHSPPDAADLASRRTADYVEAPALPLSVVVSGRLPASAGSARRRVLIAARGGGTTTRWLREQAVRGLASLGATSEIIDDLWQDPDGMKARLGSDVVLAVLSDVSRAVAEIKQVVAHGKPVVAFADDPEVLGVIRGADVVTTSDLCSALYLTQWIPV